MIPSKVVVPLTGLSNVSRDKGERSTITSYTQVLMTCCRLGAAISHLHIELSRAARSFQVRYARNDMGSIEFCRLVHYV